MDTAATESLQNIQYLVNDCAYIKGNISSTEYNVVSDPSPEEAEVFLNQGWRRFGKMFFRPQCQGCRKCIPLRVKISDFKRSKNMRKIINKNAHIEVRHCRPQTTLYGLQLHNKYHRYQRSHRQWGNQDIGPLEYNILFAEPLSFAEEHRYYDGEKLVGISYVDKLPNTLSAVYFFYDPEWSDLSPGTFSILHELAYAESLGLEYYHLGYYVAGCPSMQYKKRFLPHEHLKGQGELWDWQDSQWVKDLDS